MKIKQLQLDVLINNVLTSEEYEQFLSQSALLCQSCAMLKQQRGGTVVRASPHSEKALGSALWSLPVSLCLGGFPLGFTAQNMHNRLQQGLQIHNTNVNK